MIDPAIEAVHNHDFAKAQEIVSKRKPNTLKNKLAQVYIFVTRSTPIDIEKGIKITSTPPIDYRLKTWHSIFIHQKLTLQKLLGKRSSSTKADFVRALHNLYRTCPKADKLRWEIALATAQKKKIPSASLYKALDTTENLKHLKTSQQLTVLADYSIALNNRSLAATLWQAYTWDTLRDGSQKNWNDPTPNLTPYNRRGFILQAMATGVLDSRQIISKFSFSSKLNCQNEMRSMLLALRNLDHPKAAPLIEKLLKKFPINLIS